MNKSFYQPFVAEESDLGVEKKSYQKYEYLQTITHIYVFKKKTI